MNVSFAEDMRRIDGAVEESYGLPAAALMENAGRRTAEEAAQLIGGPAGKAVCVFAGGGNNGGDAFAAARSTMWRFCPMRSVLPRCIFTDSSRRVRRRWA